ncbi:unnamed protein product [Arctogadus glacialis]
MLIRLIGKSTLVTESVLSHLDQVLLVSQDQPEGSVHHATRAHGLYLTDPWWPSLIGPAGARSAGSQSGSPAGQ